MLGKFLRAIKNPEIKGLAKKNFFSFYNEVPKFDPSKDYYRILEVGKDSTESEIKKSYYRLAKSYHPDSNPGKQAKFKEVNEAYSVLSDSNLRKQYNSARSFQGFTRNMGNKAKEGNYHYEEYRSMYSNLSPEEQAEVLEQTKKKLRKVIFFGLAMIILAPFLVRRNHRYYILDNGQLVPVQFQGGMFGGMVPPAGAMGPYGQAPFPGQPQQQGYYRPPQPGMYQQQPPPGYQQPYNYYQGQPQSSGNPHYNNYRPPNQGYAPPPAQ